jgi:predicted flap endonuclease-1-like 5' DNA nuclease
MRSDYALYAVAIIFFVITGITYAALQSAPATTLSVVATTVLGLLFLVLGYTVRPKGHAIGTVETQPSTQPTSLPAVASPTPLTVPTIPEAVKEEKAETVVEVPPPPPKMELTNVKGIKEKRASQLTALGIKNVEDLANASAKDLAEKLKISPKFTERWIEDAKKLLAKS